MSRRPYSTSSPPPAMRAIAGTSNHSQDSKFASDVSGSSPVFPDSSSSSQVMPQNRKQEEMDFTVPIIYEGRVLPLHSNEREILEDTPIQKNNYNPINDVKNGKAVNSMMKSKPNVPNTAAAEKEKPKMEKSPNIKMAQSSESEPAEVNIDDKVSYYINRAKLKIRTVSNIGGRKSGNEKDTVNGRFTDYINRAKLRLRTTSTISEEKNFPKAG